MFVALSECKKYGTLESYLEMLFDLKDKLQDIQLYELIFVIEDMRSGNMNSMTDYYLVEILKVIQESFLNDLEKCSKIAALEWLCRNILEWEQMKCMQYMMKIDPSIYANLVQIIYKSDEDGDIVDKEKYIQGHYKCFEVLTDFENGTFLLVAAAVINTVAHIWINILARKVLRENNEIESYIPIADGPENLLQSSEYTGDSNVGVSNGHNI